MDLYPLAHPLLQHGALPLSPLALTAVNVCLVAVIAVGVPWRAREEAPASSNTGASWEATLHPVQVVTRTAAVLLLILAVAAGRLGSLDELDNLAPALVVGAAWPLLLVGSALLGPIWRWLDPWDALARVGHGPEDAQAPAPAVWWALPAVVVWTWYLGAYPYPLAPRSIGALLGLYTIVTLAGCLALGRAAWLSRAEPLGLLLTWTAGLRRGILGSWQSPRGAEVVLGALAGGLLFGALRTSELWGGLNVAPNASLYAALGLVAGCALGGGLLWGLERWSARGGPPGGVAAACVPAVAALAVALALGRNRLFTSLQLLPGLAGDPFGLGWDLFGPALEGLDPAPLGVTGLAVAQVLILVAGHIAGAVVLARRTESARRMAGLLSLGAILVPATIAIAAA